MQKAFFFVYRLPVFKQAETKKTAPLSFYGRNPAENICPAP